MTELTDEAIVVQVQTGDSEAFGELISRYEEKMKRYGRKFLSDSEDIEDLVQEAFIKAYTNLQSFDAERRFSPWLYRIAHNTFVNELRRRGRYGSSIFEADTILPLIPAKETADAAALHDEERQQVEALLEELSPKYREVVVLFYIEELSYQEISEVLQIPVNTVGVRMNRARAKLKTIAAANNIEDTNI